MRERELEQYRTCKVTDSERERERHRRSQGLIMPVAIAATVVAKGRQSAPTIAICDPEDERVTSNSQGKRRSGDDHLAAVAATTTTTATTTIGGGEWRAAWGCRRHCEDTEDERSFGYCERKLPVTSSAEEGDSGHTHLSRLKL